MDEKYKRKETKLKRNCPDEEEFKVKDFGNFLTFSTFQENYGMWGTKDFQDYIDYEDYDSKPYTIDGTKGTSKSLTAFFGKS